MNQQNICIAIGKNIRQKRLEIGLSEDGLAAWLCIKLQRLQAYENGSASLTCDELIHIAVMLRCSVDELCRGSA